jgi:hypothetical protein
MIRNFPTRLVQRSVAALSLALLASAALAQTPPPALDLQLHDLPQPSDDDAAPADFATDGGTSVHGSFTSGIGYSKNFGNSTFNAAELNVSRRTDDGGNVDLHVAVARSTGMPYASPPDYVRRYP